MYFLEAHDKAKDGQRIMRKAWRGCHEPIGVIKGKYLSMHYDCRDGKQPINDGLCAEDWYVDDKIKVTIDGKEGYISKESAEELKKMLS